VAQRYALEQNPRIRHVQYLRELLLGRRSPARFEIISSQGVHPTEG
jgi:hypothetical protein